MTRAIPRSPPPSLVAYELAPGKVLFTFDRPPAPAVEGLSPAENEVLALLLAGCPNADIARARGTSVRTVTNQVASIFRKTNVGSRAELTAKLLAEPSTP